MVVILLFATYCRVEKIISLIFLST